MAKVIFMYSFDENALIGKLGAQSSQVRIAFATAAATRQLRNYERFAHEFDPPSEQRPREIVTQLWAALKDGAVVDLAAWSAILDEVMNLIPEESDEWVILHAFADDALSTLAYAIRCLVTPDPQEAAWAARRAYEAADQAAIRFLDVQPGTPATELEINSHEIVQRELWRQQNDLALLSVGSIETAQCQALDGELLTNAEINALF